MALSEIYRELGERVSQLRETNGKLTQQELGSRVGISRATIASIEAGRQNVSLQQLYSLAEALGVESLSELIPMNVPKFEPTIVSETSGLSPIQVTQIETLLRNAVANAKLKRKS